MNPIDVEEWEDELGMMGFGYYDNSNQTSRILQYAEVNKKILSNVTRTFVKKMNCLQIGTYIRKMASVS